MTPGPATVRLTGLEVFGRHGVFTAERDLGQRFVVDLALELPSCVGCDSDALTDTVDYAAMAESVAALVAGEPVALLERLAELIAGVALADPRVGAVQVTVRKPHVALPQTVREVSVSLRRQRGGNVSPDESVVSGRAADAGAPMRYWLGLGANLGDRAATIRAALEALSEAGVAVEAVSPIYETAPREVADQAPFLNAACRVRTVLDPPALLDLVKGVERRLGRRPGPRFGPRAIDCDLLLWEGGQWREARLQIPHPRLAQRRFALLPLIDLDPELALPDGRRLTDLERAIDPARQPARRLGAAEGAEVP